ncbi:MAG TPA: NAD(P)H-dependent oxidoreductase [Hanamia sp.]
MKEKTPLIISGSARGESDTKLYLDLIFNSSNKRVINLLDFNICHYNYDAKYPTTDEFDKLINEMLKHDTIIFATPVYWYSMSGHMKILFDRFTDLVTIKKEVGRKLKGKSILLFAVGADPEIPEGFEIPFKLTAQYLDMKYKGYIYFNTQKDSLKQQKSD